MHLSLNKDPPKTRTVEPPELGTIVAFPLSVVCIIDTGELQPDIDREE